jgi:hypothetical protein
MHSFVSRASIVVASLSSLPLLWGTGCSSKNSVQADDAGTTTGSGPLAKDDYCEKCSFSSQASQTEPKTPRTVNACCVYVAPPTGDLKRGIGLHYFSGSDPTVSLGCLDAPPSQGTPQTIKLRGYVKLFSSGNDSEGVKIEIFKEGPNGALGDLVGAAVTTTNDDAKNPVQMPKPEWLKKCPSGGCNFRSFEYPGVPTETPLIIRTKDASATALKWSEVYDYNIVITNAQVGKSDGCQGLQMAAGEACYDITAAAATDINTVASAAGGFTISPNKGVLAGEVHDCGDVRISGATVDTDVPHEGDMFYFADNEADPLPDKSRRATSTLGLFGALNLATGVPVRVSAVGRVNGELTLLGTQTVQLFPGAVTAFSFRGRRFWQK